MEVPPLAGASIEDVRRSVTYHPTIWGDYFLAYSSQLTEISSSEEEELQRLRDEVRELLATTPDCSLHKLELIDAIRRLGVGYHFEEEMEESLKHVHLESNVKEEDNDLHAVALRFRLLRQEGYNISSDAFDIFINHEGKFEESLVNDVRGMLSLYEAAQFAVHGEEILDEALRFSSSHLESTVVNMSSSTSLAAQVKEALKTPIQKSLTRLHAARFISSYQEDDSRYECLLNFAKLDFNVVQKMHQKELKDITRWWKALDFRNKLPFARDRMVECYFWILGMYFEPQFQVGRMILTKVIALGSVMDDIYDVYGTIDELHLLTQAIQRWDISAMEQLPPYLRIFYEALLNVYAEIEELEEKEDDRKYRANYAKEEMKKLAGAYFQETEWTYKGHVPTLEEYMKVGIVSAGYVMLALTSLVGMGNLVTEEDYQWVSSEPLIVRASSLVARLMDDMAGHGFETKFSAVDCYMKERGATREEAFDELEKRVRRAWKDVNQECLNPTAVAKSILSRVVNSARVIYLLYKDGDGYTNSKAKMKEAIKSVLVQPMTI